jgi:hypothetical protein
MVLGKKSSVVPVSAMPVRLPAVKLPDPMP